MNHQTHLYHFYELSYGGFRKPYFTIIPEMEMLDRLRSPLGRSLHATGYAADRHQNVPHQEFLESFQCQKLRSGMFQ